MAFYHFLILTLLLLAMLLFNVLKADKSRFIFILISGIILFFIAGFRSETVGNDTIPYLHFYKKILTLDNITQLDSRFEPGYIFFNRLLSLFFPFNQGILIGSSFVIIFSYFYFIYKESKNVWLSVYLFITLRYFYGMMNTIRHDLAISILLFAYRFLLEKKLFKFILSVLFASSFHSIAIFFIFAYPLVYAKFNLRNVVISSSLFLFIYFNFIDTIEFIIAFFGKYEGYITSGYFRENLLASFFVLGINISVLLFMIYIIKFAVKKNKLTFFYKFSNSKISESDLMLNLIYVGTMISFLALKGNILGRISSLFITFAIVYIPNCLYMLKNHRERIIYIYVIMIACLLYHTIIFIFRPEWNYVIPYSYFWE